jgi:hypothetical protein
VTSNIPSAIDNHFLSYTYATLSDASQPGGNRFFGGPNDPVPARTFDAALDPTGQGYAEGYYDVVIAFWVMHAMTDL